MLRGPGPSRLRAIAPAGQWCGRERRVLRRSDGTCGALRGGAFVPLQFPFGRGQRVAGLGDPACDAGERALDLAAALDQRPGGPRIAGPGDYSARSRLATARHPRATVAPAFEFWRECAAVPRIAGDPDAAGSR